MAKSESDPDVALLQEFVRAVETIGRSAAPSGVMMQPQPTVRMELDRLYAALPHRFPPLYEKLLLGYRWDDLDLGTFVLGANPAGRTLGGIHGALTREDPVARALLKSGFLQLGRAALDSADPVCFATARRRPDRDCPVVRLDRQELSRRGRMRVVRELARSYRDLLEDVVFAARRAR